MNRKPMAVLISVLVCGMLVGSATAQSDGPLAPAEPQAPELSVSSAFTFQGMLQRHATAYTGTCDMQFNLSDSAAAGLKLGSPQSVANVSVSQGVFAVQLNFGNQFDGTARWVEPEVKCADDEDYTKMPKVALDAVPYAMSLVPGAVIDGSIPYGTGAATVHAINRSASDGTALFGHATAVTGNTAGVFGLGNSPNGAGVWGKSTDGVGVFGESTNGPAASFSGQALIQAPAGTIPLKVKQDTPESSTPALALFETSNGAVGSLGAGPGIFVIGSAAGKALGFSVNSTTRAMTIGSDGNVGIGTNIIFAKGLEVAAPNAAANDLVFRVNESTSALNRLSVYNNGTVAFGDFASATTNDLCWRQTAADLNFLTKCSSAAEYVPTIAGGAGFPETADLVSIASDAANPYGDDHSPFVVTQSTKPCDPNLLGYIVDPESGASGEKVNDHYLPLAIYGYFPAKVTVENGAIQRGDALTSSSKPGHAMKATQACKIIGYALEDAQQDGMIQVFANFGESAGRDGAALQSQVEALSQTVADLQQKLAALEQAQAGQAAAQGMTIPREAVLVGAVLFAGLVVVRRADRSRSN